MFCLMYLLDVCQDIIITYHILLAELQNSKINTFTIGFEDKIYDESINAKVANLLVQIMKKLF